MKVFLPLLALPLAGAAPHDMDGQDGAAEVQEDFSDLAERNCTDTIRTVREESGQPLIQRGTANADEPILFYALDHEVEGCDVLLVSRNGDVRDLPLADEGPVRAEPAQ